MIIPRNDNLTNKLNEVNSRLTNICQQRNIKFISQTNTLDPAKDLNECKFNLNNKELQNLPKI